MYKSISPNLNFVEEEKKVEKFWEDENIFEKSIAEREGDKPYVFPYQLPDHLFFHTDDQYVHPMD